MGSVASDAGLAIMTMMADTSIACSHHSLSFSWIDMRVVGSITLWFLVFIIAVGTSSAFAQQPQRRLTNTEKCAIYKDAFDTILAKNKGGLLSEPFIAENIAFIESGCVEYSFVCPRNQADLNVANQLTVATMNRGLASTFVPFKCP